MFKKIAIIVLILFAAGVIYGWQPGPWQQNKVYYKVYFISADGADTTLIDGGDVNCADIGISGTGKFGVLSNGQSLNIKSGTTELTAMSGATVTYTNGLPAGSLILGVTARVTTLITGATSFDIGDGTDIDRWGATIAVAANTTMDGTKFTIASPPYYASVTNIVLTANGGNFTAGAVRLTVHYLDFTAATN